MSADRPSPALDPGHPLHSILSGFSEPADDVLADDEGGGGATVEPGPPRPSSAGRPLDEAESEPFTPPVPALALHELVDREHAGRTSLPIRERAHDVLASLPRTPRPSPKLAATVLALVVIAAVMSVSDRSADPPAAPPRSADERTPTRPAPAPQRGRPQRSRPQRRRSHERPTPRHARRPAVRTFSPAIVAPARPPGPAPAPVPTGSHFTSEFTP